LHSTSSAKSIISSNEFEKSILEKDLVILSAVNTGFPVFGKDFFYGGIKK